MSSIEIIQQDIATADVDAVVNAANNHLLAGSGVCGAIFAAAGYDELQAACDAIGYCETGNAVITDGFGMKAKYIIHAVGPVWNGGGNGEAEALYNCYKNSLELAREYDCHSIAFPVISSGIFGYPKEEALEVALTACKEYLNANPSHDIKIFIMRR